MYIHIHTRKHAYTHTYMITLTKKSCMKTVLYMYASSIQMYGRPLFPNYLANT